jgi:hypothetical protein
MASATELNAQSYRLEADADASRIAYEGAAALNAGSLGLLGEYSGPSFFGRARASWTGFEGGPWSLQGGVNLAGWLAPLGRPSPVRWELGGAVSGLRLSSDFDTRSARIETRVHVLSARRGGWLGLGLAGARNSYDSASVDAWQPEVGAWLQAADVRGSLSYRYTRLNGASYPELSASLAFSRRRIDLVAFAGIREWPGDAGLGDELWAGASVAWWLTQNTALTIAGGAYPWDVLQALSGGEYLSIGLKITPRRVRPIPVSATAPIVFTPEQARDGSITFPVRGASRVEIAGDWTGWNPVPLAQDVAGRWVLPATLEPGAYRFNLRVDGARWMVPEGFPVLDDGFGGTVGLLIVADTGPEL